MYARASVYTRWTTVCARTRAGGLEVGRGRGRAWMKRPLRYTKSRKLIVRRCFESLHPVTLKVRLNQFSVSRPVESRPIEPRQLGFHRVTKATDNAYPAAHRGLLPSRSSRDGVKRIDNAPCLLFRLSRASAYCRRRCTKLTDK